MNPPVQCTEGRGEGDEDIGKSNSPASSCTDSGTEGMKRAAAKQLIERYYYQLTDGCGKNGCENEFCASSPNFHYPSISKNTAALRAIELLKGKAELCDPSKPSKVAKNGSTSVSQQHDCHQTQSDGHSTSDSVCGDQPSTSGTSSSLNFQCSNILSSTTNAVHESASQSTITKHQTSPVQVSRTVPPYLTEDIVVSVLKACIESQNWSKLNRLIGSVFNNFTSLMRSFNKEENKHVSEKESQSMDMELDKDTDETVLGDGSSPESSDKKLDKQEVCGYKNYRMTIDLESLRRAYAKLFSIPALPFQASLINALIYLSRELEMDLKYHHIVEKDPSYLNIFITVMEIPILHTPEFIDSATPHFCRMLGQLPIVAQAGLAHEWAKFSRERLKVMVENLQQLITVKVISTNWNRQHFLNDDEVVAGAVRVMKIVFCASVIGGEMDLPEIISAEEALNREAEDSLQELFQGAVGHEPKEKLETKPDPLAKELGINSVDCRKPLVPWEDFINEPLCEHIEMEREYRDYQNFKTENESKFSFLAHPFILTTAIKNQGMNFDNRIRMLNERRQSIFQSIVHGAPNTPYLRLKIRRDHIIDDALIALELVAMDNPQDLKKQLYVEFEGEQGIDEGGVSKEFFQLVVEEMFNPDIGMFTFDEETQKFWFNPTSFENDGQFTLIGIVLGLAIYNNVILDVHFPMVVYRKLMGKLGTFDDLKDSHPILANGLQELLNFEGCVEDIMQTFRITYKDIFGSILDHELKENGKNLPVNNENRKEFVSLYADFLLNKSIERQFRAFKRGFQMVTDESPLKWLFRPEEVELLVCGSKNFDFRALEEAAEYDGGFSAESSTIKQFWDVVHAMADDQKKKLLQFTTGSDRVPVGGLAKLKLIIARNGPDSDRLPTSHTCFNVLLLPEYSSKEKLLERLLKAISYAKGFGML